MLDEELSVATALARQAGRLLLDIYATDFEVRFKGRSNPVTEADTRANTYLVRELRERFPRDGVVGEENVDQSDALRKERCWYVDPLDGTKEFIAKNGEFAVMLGLAIQGEARLGVVYQPVLDKLYRGVVGQAAHLEKNGVVEPLQVSTTANLRNLRLVVSRSHRSKHIDALVQALGLHDVSQSGSVGLKVGLIAEQAADLYVHVSNKTSAWDSCGPEAILRAAGGKFTDLTGARISYGGADLHNTRGILACNAAAFDQVQPVAQKIAQDTGFLP